MLETLGKIGFDWPVALANLINFIIIFFILKRFAFKPIQKIVNERQKKIEEGIENAEKAEANLLAAEKTKEKKIEEARMKANQIIATAQKKGDEMLDETQIRAVKEKERIIRDGEQAVEESKKKIKKEVEKEMSGLIIDGIEKVLQENLNEETQKDYIKKSLGSYALKK
jgi:F-type H+-transporting ATPase subunit b